MRLELKPLFGKIRYAAFRPLPVSDDIAGAFDDYSRVMTRRV
jgi:hypothetical protein